MNAYELLLPPPKPGACHHPYQAELGVYLAAWPGETRLIDSLSFSAARSLSSQHLNRQHFPPHAAGLKLV
jgi:hypothetical protein